MRDLSGFFKGDARRRLLVAAFALAAFASSSLLASAARVNDIVLTVVNGSTTEISHVFLSSVDQDDWGGDQLNDVAIAPGETRTITIACNQSQIKVIGENRDGCFHTTVIDCSAAAAWAITNTTPADCGY